MNTKDMSTKELRDLATDLNKMADNKENEKLNTALEKMHEHALFYRNFTRSAVLHGVTDTWTEDANNMLNQVTETDLAELKDNKLL